MSWGNGHVTFFEISEEVGLNFKLGKKGNNIHFLVSLFLCRKEIRGGGVEIV